MRTVLEPLEVRRLLAGVQLVADLRPGPEGGAVHGPIDAGLGRVAFDADLGGPTWPIPERAHLTDGTPAGTAPVSAATPDAPYAGPLLARFAAGDRVFMEAEGSARAVRRDGTDPQTLPFQFGYGLYTDAGIGRQVATFGDTHYFNAFVGNGLFATPRLVRSDGTAAGSETFVDTGAPHYLKRIGGVLYAHSFGPLRRTAGDPNLDVDGTLSFDVLASPPNVGVDGNSEVLDVGGKIFFVGRVEAFHPAPANPYRIYTTDGTQAGSALLDFPAADGPYSDPDLVAANGAGVWFTAASPGFGRELWFTDGTPAGTRRLTDAAPGTGAFDFAEAIVIDDTLVARMGAFEPAFPNGPGVWASDGTPAGTLRLGGDLQTYGFRSPYLRAEWLVEHDGLAYFAGYDATHGAELWRTDGTDAGTALVADVRPGPQGGLSPGAEATGRGFASLAVSGGQIYFVADDGAGAGRELFRYDPGDALAPRVLAAEADRARGNGFAEVRFSEDVEASLLAATPTLVDRVTGVALPLGTVEYDRATRTARWPLPALADGDYRFTLAAGSVEDYAGNALAAATVVDFHALAGDADLDRDVDFADLAALAASYGQPGRTRAQGNADGSADGVVGFGDLALVAARYGTALPLPRAGTDGRAERVARSVL